ncbi:alginate biosynthetic protein AlgK [Marinobacter lipolyticus SM19]|uniref:Alginate biosynthetic protein AlgK n=1 Tax=Marinobacter lipolyticus SM19 TaxID=1318628 RepID=R8AZG3_9GAMM|nr:SEL1-like repeat protein [Marinobacter lipolyticus]EON91730.1 alginate biosynthetic protein AlgK [Marinobacter lipolyticus SM19]
MIRVACIVGLFSLGLSGCGNLPDIERAEKAAAAGNVEDARSQLEELARFGLADAQVELGDLYADQDTPAARQKALEWYQKAAEQGSDRASIRIGKMNAREGDTPEQRANGARYLRRALAEGDKTALIPLINLYMNFPKEFPNGKPVELIKQARAAGDPKGDIALARYYVLSGQFENRTDEIESLCVPIAEAQPECFQLLARVYLAEGRNEDFETLVGRARQAWEQGTIEDRDLYLFARWLSDDESPQKQVATTNELYLMLTPGYVPALTARAKLIMENNYLAEPEVVIQMLQQARDNGDLKASLSLARAYERGRIVPADPEKAVRYAMEVREKYPSAEYLLGRIYKRGYLGEPDPEKAKHHLLTAARRGFPKADYALAELYWEAKGIEVNRLYAWSFAQLALDGGVERARELMVEMVLSVPEHTRMKAKALYKQERAARRQMFAKGAFGPAQTTEQGG